MPMPIRYVLKPVRPKNKIQLNGRAALQGRVVLRTPRCIDYVEPESETETDTDTEVEMEVENSRVNQDMLMSHLIDDAEAGEVLGYWSPAGMYACDSGRVPRSVIHQSIIIEMVASGECIYTRLRSEVHFSIFMQFTRRSDQANVTLGLDSSIKVKERISASVHNPVLLVCDWGGWRILFNQCAYPTLLVRLNADNLKMTRADQVEAPAQVIVEVPEVPEVRVGEEDKEREEWTEVLPVETKETESQVNTRTSDMDVGVDDLMFLSDEDLAELAKLDQDLAMCHDSTFGNAELV